MNNRKRKEKNTRNRQLTNEKKIQNLLRADYDSINSKIRYDVVAYIHLHLQVGTTLLQFVDCINIVVY